jgi:disulfide bond formation protein DsbB
MTREEILAQPIVTTLNHYLAILTIVAIVALIAWAITITIKDKNNMVQLVARHATLIGLIATLTGTLLSLFYSKVLHMEPCELCWYQRILLYPQVVLFAVALWKKERSVWLYSVWLSVIGGAIALYHHALQMGYDIYKPCSTALFAADCSKPEFVEFGFVTFPFMSFIMFATLILLYFTHKRSPRTEAL